MYLNIRFRIYKLRGIQDESESKPLFSLICTVDVVYTWKYGGPNILITICANKMKLCVYNAYVL